MKTRLSRREFLKLSGAVFGSLAFRGTWFDPVFPLEPERDHGLLARVASYREVDLRTAPRDDAPIIGKRYRDQLVQIYSEVVAPEPKDYPNRLWYRVWGGYIHSAHTQLVKIKLNEAERVIRPGGELCEITVPYSIAYQFNKYDGWIVWRGSRLYYSSTHWATGLEEGPDGEPWYQITSELSKVEKYFVPARHLRLIQPAEFAPLSTDVRPQDKRIVISLREQKLRAYEGSLLVLETSVSTGIPSTNTAPGELPTATPQGTFGVILKTPSKHMGTLAGGEEVEANSGFSLPGVPWTLFFKLPGGYALHGTYWHNNFGLRMSHGCINMRNDAVLWLFRWTDPPFDPYKIETPDDWYSTGFGTLINIEAT
jgi:hypothetical protein